VLNLRCTGRENAYKFITDVGSYGYAMKSYEVQVLFRVERCGMMITDATLPTTWLLETLRVQFRYVMAPKINEMIHLVSLTMTVLSVRQSVEGKLTCL
jgi:ABC-type ATPase with predicted acetyltransferase domain